MFRRETIKKPSIGEEVSDGQQLKHIAIEKREPDATTVKGTSVNTTNAWRKFAQQFSNERCHTRSASWINRSEGALHGGCIERGGLHTHPIKLRVGWSMCAEVGPCQQKRQACSKPKFRSGVAVAGMEVTSRRICIRTRINKSAATCIVSKCWDIAIVVCPRSQRTITPINIGDGKQRGHQGIVPWRPRCGWWG
jgi:hypothetical protein